MERLHLIYKASNLSYIRFGTGPKTAICFHGYGEEAISFSFLERCAGQEYSFFSIDLPFHGKTEWNDGYDCTVDDLQQIVERILKDNDRSPVVIQNVVIAKETTQAKEGNHLLTLMGYSLGGRMALALHGKMFLQIEKLVLLAPDGLKVNFWYWLSTQTWIGNKLFSLTMKHPFWFFGFLKLLNKLKLVNASIFKFVNYYIGDKEVRRLLYARWTTLRKITPNLNRIKSFIRNNRTKVRLVYGMHDRIILSSVGEKFKNGIEEYCTISIIHSGHQVLHEKHAEEIISALID